MEVFKKKLKALFPDDYNRWERIIEEREKYETFDKVVGTTDDGKDIHLTNDPEKMLLCGARIQSSYSPSSPSFKYLPSMVLQPYIGMLYVTDGQQYYIATDEGDIVAPNYLVRAFVMFTGDISAHQIGYVMPEYTDYHKLYGTFDEFYADECAFVTSDTPPIEIHLDCIQQYKNGTGHLAVAGWSILPLEYRSTHRFKGVK